MCAPEIEKSLAGLVVSKTELISGWPVCADFKVLRELSSAQGQDVLGATLLVFDFRNGRNRGITANTLSRSGHRTFFRRSLGRVSRRASLFLGTKRGFIQVRNKNGDQTVLSYLGFTKNK